MKSLIRHAMASFVLTFVAGAGMAHAQSSSQVVKAHIPFEFSVGDQTLPAGDYSITHPLQNFLVMRNEQGRTVAAAFTHGLGSSTEPSIPELRFSLAGGRYTLAEVWQPDRSPSGQEVVEPRSSRAATKQQPAETVAESTETNP